MMRLIDNFINLFVYIDKICNEIDNSAYTEKPSRQKKINTRITELIYIENKKVKEYNFNKGEELTLYEYSHKDINNAYLAICSWIEERMSNTKWGKNHWRDISIYSKFQIFDNIDYLNSSDNSNFTNFLKNNSDINLRDEKHKKILATDSKKKFFNKLSELQDPINPEKLKDEDKELNILKDKLKKLNKLKDELIKKKKPKKEELKKLKSLKDDLKKLNKSKDKLEKKLQIELDILELFYFCLAFGLKEEPSSIHNQKDTLYNTIIYNKELTKESGEFDLLKHSKLFSEESFKTETLNDITNNTTKPRKLIKSFFIICIINILISIGMLFIYPAIINSLINEIL